MLVGLARVLLARSNGFSSFLYAFPSGISHPSTRSRLNCLSIILHLHAASTFSINPFFSSTDGRVAVYVGNGTGMRNPWVNARVWLGLGYGFDIRTPPKPVPH